MSQADTEYGEAFRLAEGGDIPGAIRAYQSILDRAPGDETASTFLAQMLLMKGEFSRGWSLHERRPLPPLVARRWHGEPLRGRRIFVQGEQGFGDNLQFARYADPLARRGGQVILGCPAGLGRLLSTVPGVQSVVEAGDVLPPLDCAVPMLSLPYLMGTRPDSIPNAVPYLSPDPALMVSWGRRLSAHPGPRVGLVWAGNAQTVYDYRRSPGFSPYRQLLDLPGISFFSLQKGDGALAPGAAPPGLVDLGPEIASFDDTAAIMTHLDLVISSCTSPAHLAGALGRPLWVVLSSFPDWRWMLDREDSPWYPTARLFRQGRGEGWDPLLGRIRQALAEVFRP